MPIQKTLANPRSTNIATNIRNDTGIQRRGRGGLSVVGSGLGGVLLGMSSVYCRRPSE
ncbi:MAG TPA: hypothetical protein VGM05_12625 [Planctomycetaceae bacterium]